MSRKILPNDFLFAFLDFCYPSYGLGLINLLGSPLCAAWHNGLDPVGIQNILASS